MADEQSFGSVIRALRREKRIDQRSLADRVRGCLAEDGLGRFDDSYLSKIENGRVPPPSVAAIRCLARELDADFDALLALAGKPPPDVQALLASSGGARRFFLSAVDLNLSEDDWRRLLGELRKG